MVPVLLRVCISVFDWGFFVSVIVVLVISTGESDAFQQWLHSFWPGLRAPGGRETVNKLELAASPGVTQLFVCDHYFMYNIKSGGMQG